MAEGGADENGSLSFSQLLYHYRFGPEPCAAHKEADLNLYHPQGNLLTMVIHTSSNGTTVSGSKVCKGGLYEGFVAETLRVTYGQGSTAQNESMQDLRGHSHPGAALKAVALTDNEDDYEVLAKAIAKYNGSGPKVDDKKINWFETRSWPRLLRYLKYDPKSDRNTATVCHSCRYSIQVRDKANVFKDQLRSYIWYGGTYPEDHSAQPGEQWCFVYGEKEWREPFTVEEPGRDPRPAAYIDYLKQAKLDDSKKMECM